MFPKVIVNGLSGLLVVLLFFIGVQGLILEDDGGTENVDSYLKIGTMKDIEGSCKLNREHSGISSASREGRILPNSRESRDTHQTRSSRIDTSRVNFEKSRRFLTGNERRIIDTRDTRRTMKDTGGSCKLNQESSGISTASKGDRILTNSRESRDTHRTPSARTDRSRENFEKSRRFFTGDERRMIETRDTRRINHGTMRKVGQRMSLSHEDQRRSMDRKDSELTRTRFERSESLRRNVKAEIEDQVKRVDRRTENSKLDRNAPEMNRRRFTIHTRIERTPSEYTARRLEDNTRRPQGSEPLRVIRTRRENSAERYREITEERVDNRRERRFNERNTIFDVNSSESMPVSSTIRVRNEKNGRNHGESPSSRDVRLNRRNSMNIRSVEEDRRAIDYSAGRLNNNIRSSRADLRMDNGFFRRTLKQNIQESTDFRVQARKEQYFQSDNVKGSSSERRVFQRVAATTKNRLPTPNLTVRDNLHMTQRAASIRFRNVETTAEERKANGSFRSASGIRVTSFLAKPEVSRRSLDRLLQFGNDRRQRQNSNRRQEHNIDINGNRIDVVSSRRKLSSMDRRRSIGRLVEGSRRTASVNGFREGRMARANEGDNVAIRLSNSRRITASKGMRSSERENQERDSVSYRMNRREHIEGRISYVRVNAEGTEYLKSRNGASFEHSELQMRKSKLRVLHPQQKRHMGENMRSTIEDSSRRGTPREAIAPLSMRNAENHRSTCGRTLNKSVATPSEQQLGNWHGTIQMTLATILVGQWLLFRGDNGKQRCILGNVIRKVQIF